MPRKRVMPKTHPIILEAREKEVLAFDLRLAGKSYSKIAEELGVQEQTAWNYVDRVLKRFSEYLRERVPEMIELEAARLEKLIDALWPVAMGEETRKGVGQLGAIDRLLNISKRKSKLLGLDTPYQMQVMHGLTPEALEELRNKRWASLEPRLLKALVDSQTNKKNVIEGEIREVEEEEVVEKPEVTPMTDKEVDVTFGWHVPTEEEHEAAQAEAKQERRIAEAEAEVEKMRVETERAHREGLREEDLPFRKIQSSGTPSS
jgi:DNA-binding Lrp family transcriptional regulator